MPCALELSCVQLFVTPWTAACQAPLSMEFCRQEHRSGLAFSTLRDLHDPGIESVSLIVLYWQVDSLPLLYLKLLQQIHFIKISEMKQIHK